MNALTTRREIFFIDARIEGYESILVGMDPAADTHILNQQTDGMSQILDTLAQSDSRYDAVHLITHGSSAQIDLPGTLINADNLQQHKASLERIGGHLSADADFLVYGCNIGGDEAGRLFTQEFSKILGVDVATSDDLTGAQALGGDAVLEVRSGRIETPAIAEEIWDESAVLLASPNIRVSSVRVEDGDESEPGDTVKISITFSNDGDAHASRFQYGVFINYNDSWKTLSTRYAPSINAGGERNSNASFRLPDDIPAGEYRIGVIADTNEKIQESNEEDNTAISANTITITAPTPPRIFSVSSPSVEEGGTLRFTVRLDRDASETTTYYSATYFGPDATATGGGVDYAGHRSTPLVFSQPLKTSK